MTLTYAAPACSQNSTIKPVCNITFVPPSVDGSQFAFARIKGDVYLVQLSMSTPESTASGSALTTVDVKIFRHEFITIFRLVEKTTLHPADIRILETIDDHSKRYEEENETVFLAKDLMERLRKMTDRGRSPQPRRFSQIGRRR